KLGAEVGFGMNITVFESSSWIGGRSTTVNAFDEPSEPVELGASIFVKVNSMLVNAVSEFNLSIESLHSRLVQESPLQLGVWDGTRFVYTQNNNSSWWWDVAKLIWKYGLAPF